MVGENKKCYLVSFSSAKVGADPSKKSAAMRFSGMGGESTRFPRSASCPSII